MPQICHSWRGVDGRNGNDQEPRRVSVGSADPPQGLSSPAQDLRNQSRCPSLGAHDRKRNGPWRLRLPSRSRTHAIQRTPRPLHLLPMVVHHLQHLYRLATPCMAICIKTTSNSNIASNEKNTKPDLCRAPNTALAKTKP